MITPVNKTNTLWYTIKHINKILAALEGIIPCLLKIYTCANCPPLANGVIPLKKVPEIALEKACL